MARLFPSDSEFTFQDEAYNTERNRHSIESKKRLSNRKVNFVSVGASACDPPNSLVNLQSTQDCSMGPRCLESSTLSELVDPTSSESDEELVIFGGRNRAQQVPELKTETHKARTSSSILSDVSISEGNIVPVFGSGSVSSLVPRLKTTTEDWADRHRQMEFPELLDEHASGLDEDIFADYIANVDSGDYVSPQNPSINLNSAASLPNYAHGS